MYKLTLEGSPGIHRRRLQALAVVVDGLLRVRRLGVVAIGRDLKSTRYGYGYPGLHTRSCPRRMANLLLVFALALWLQWCIGWDQRERARVYQTNSSRRRTTAVLSIITTAAIHIQQQGSPHLTRRGLARVMRHLQAINAWWST